ncbi:hypothetical protein ACLOJK_040180 [Asimina triloba]
MGCNGSKLDVANGNAKTTGYSLLRRRKSEVSDSKASAAAASPAEPDVSSVKNPEAQKPSVGSGEEKSAAAGAEVKEITINGEKDGKELKGESPAEAEKENIPAGGGETSQFFSPMEERVVVNCVDGKEAGEAAKTDGQDDKVVIGVADVGGNGEKPSGEDLKEPILVEPTTLLERVIASKERADAEEHAAEKQTTAEASTKGP